LGYLYIRDGRVCPEVVRDFFIDMWVIYPFVYVIKCFS
jgi:hypothetical protein